MITPKEQMHHLDLEQIETLEKLNTRLGQELQAWKANTQKLAMAENAVDRIKIEKQIAETPIEGEHAINQVVKERDKALVSSKSAVWNTSNMLKKLHERRNILKAQQIEQTEELTAVDFSESIERT